MINIADMRMGLLGAANISIFSPTTSFGRFGGGRGFAQDVFKLRRYIEKKV